MILHPIPRRRVRNKGRAAVDKQRSAFRVGGTNRGGAVENLEAISIADLIAEILARVGATGGSAGSTGSDADDDLALLDAAGVAALLKIPVARVYELQRRRQIGSIRDGRTVRFSRGHVAEYQRKRSVSAR
jgi:excisionase family DNA binding protein